MANTYTQLYVHIVFSVKGRHALIPECHKAELHKYITGILTNKKQITADVNGDGVVNIQDLVIVANAF